MRSLPIFLALTLALAGCASTPRVSESQLTGLIELPVGTSQAIPLPAPLHYTVPADGRAGNGRQFHLVAGTYRPYKYNQAGTFYLGEQPAVVERKPAAPGPAGTVLRIGGIWIPSNPALAPKLFIVPDYYKQLPDGAPVPDRMRVADLAEFRHQPVVNGQPGLIYIPATIPGTLKVISPLHAGLAAAAITGVLVLLNEPGASHELVFAAGEIADPASVRQLRTAFPPVWR